MMDELARAERFYVEFEQTYLHGNILGAANKITPDILFLHGNELSEEANDFFLLRQFLLKRAGISSCAFDFVGHGNTGGDWASSSLYHRTCQAGDVAEACFDSKPFMIVAAGAGAYTAIRLTELFPINNLILITPSVHAPENYLTCFGEIGEQSLEGSFLVDWERTDAWSIIEKFRGGVSIIGASETKTTFSAVISRLYSHSVRASGRQAVELMSNGCSSQLIKNSDKEAPIVVRLAEVIRQVSDGLNAGVPPVVKECL